VAKDCTCWPHLTGKSSGLPCAGIILTTAAIVSVVQQANCNLSIGAKSSYRPRLAPARTRKRLCPTRHPITPTDPASSALKITPITPGKRTQKAMAGLCGGFA